jgi:hypothetical protein
VATSDFKVKKGLQVGSGDFAINVDNSTAAFGNGYTVSIGTATVITDADNISLLANDANYITLTDISATGDITYNNATGEISFTQRTDAQVKELLSATGDISYDNSTGVISFNNATGYITLAGLSAGTGVTYNSSTGAISIGQAVGTTDNVTFADVTATKIISSTIESSGADVTIDDNLIVSGNLTVNGTTTSLNTTTLDVEDLNITVAKGAADAAAADGAGLTVDGANATFTYAATGDKWVANKTIDANVLGNVTGDLTGNADTASKWATARTITLGGDLTGNVSIDGSGDVTLTATVAADSVALGADTTGQYASTVAVSGVGLLATEANADDGTAYTITSNATDANTASTIVARDASGNFTAGTITANLTGNVTGQVSDISNHTTTALTEGTNLYYTETRFDTSFSGKSTTNLTEGSSLYFTNTRARTAISVSGSLSYDNATGIISYTERTDAQIRALFSATGDISYDSATGVISYSAAGDLGDFTNNAGYIKLADLSAGGDLSYNNSTGEFSFTQRTDAEVRGLLSAAGDLTYNSTSGEFSVTTYKTADFETDLAVASIGDLADVDITSIGNVPTDGQVLIWDNANSKFVPADFYTTSSFETDLASSNTNQLAEGTDNSVGETTPGAGDGTNNLYYTDARSRSAISVTGDLGYNSATGELSYTAPTALSEFTNDTNFITLTSLSATGSLNYNNATGTFSFTERTDSEVRGLISATGSLTYDSSTGVISFTERTDAQVRGLISGVGNITYSSATGQISFNNTSGYITSYTETQTLDDVTTLGNTTANAIEVGGLTVNGNLTVTGETTYINTTTLNIGDNIITLNADLPNDTAPSQNTGILINRGSAFDVSLRFNETNDEWEFTNDGSAYTTLATKVSDLTNDSNFAALTDISATGDISYDNATGVISFNNTSNFITITDISATGDISYDSATGVISFNNTTGFITSFSETDTLTSVTGRGNSTTNTAEFGGLTVGGTSVALAGANISTFTNDSNFISRAGISATGDISYSSATGVISFNNSSGYITAESDTLASVTGRGASTTTDVTFSNSVTVGQKIYSNGIVLQTETGTNKTNVELQNGYIKFDYINQAYVNGDIWLSGSQQNTVGGVTRKIASPNALGTNIPGNTISIEAGVGSGNASSGNIVFKTGSQGVNSGSVTSTITERLRINGTDGAVVFNNAYKFPTTDGLANNYLKTDGSGQLTFGQILYSQISGTPTLAAVATSGSYLDLSNVPTNISTFINDAGYITSQSDLVGSVFADDSTLLVDGLSGRLITSRLSQDGAISGQALVWNGTAWVPGSVSGANLAINLGDLNDVDTPTKSSGDFLQWDGVNNKWVAASAGEATGVTTSQAEELAFIAALILG